MLNDIIKLGYCLNPDYCMNWFASEDGGNYNEKQYVFNLIRNPPQ
jgi:hypothetical protein